MKAVPPKAEDQPPEDQSSESSGDETDKAVCHQGVTELRTTNT